MSHVATVDVEITNLDDLDAACKRIGLELVRGQTEYRWYGAHVGDYPLPDGFSVDDLGKCEHAIRVPLDSPFYLLSPSVVGNVVISEIPYEIGVVRRRDGKPGFQLLWDFYRGGVGLNEFVGGPKSNHDGKMPKLKQSYAFAAASRVAKQRGFRVLEQQLPNGSVRMLLTK